MARLGDGRGAKARIPLFFRVRMWNMIMCNWIDSLVNQTQLPEFFMLVYKPGTQQQEKTRPAIFFAWTLWFVPCACFMSLANVLCTARALVAFTRCQVLQVPSNMPPCAAFLTFQGKINKVTSVLPRYFRLGGPPSLVHGKIGDAWLKNQRFNPTEAYDDI